MAAISLTTGQEFQLSVGDTIHLDVEKLVYIVQLVTTYPSPKLILKLKHGDNNFPKILSVEMNKSLALGSDLVPEFGVLPNIARQHALIFWSAEKQVFIYQHLGQSPILIITKKVVSNFKAIDQMDKMIRPITHELDDSDEINHLSNHMSELAEFANPGAVPAVISSQVNNQKLQLDDNIIIDVTALITELKRHSAAAEKVLRLELRTEKTPLAERRGKHKPQETLLGYGLLLKCYLCLNGTIPSSQLTKQQKLIIIKLADTFIQLAQDEQILWDIYNNSTFPFFINSTKLNEYLLKKYDELISKKHVFLYSGTREHLELAKYTLHYSQGRLSFHRVIYNAGFEAIKVNETEVYGVEEKELKGSSKEYVIALMANETKKLATNPHDQHLLKSFIEMFLYNRYSAQIADYLEPLPLRRVTVPKQGKDNCTTRAARELIRDSLPSVIFDDIYAFISDENNSLEMLIQKLNDALFVNKLIADMRIISIPEVRQPNVTDRGMRELANLFLINSKQDIQERYLIRDSERDDKKIVITTHDKSTDLDEEILHSNLPNNSG